MSIGADSYKRFHIQICLRTPNLTVNNNADSRTFTVDGGCRGNGNPGSIAAAAAVFKLKWGRQKIFVQDLPSEPRPTNQRAELTAIILALQRAIERYNGLRTNPRFKLTIYSDSQYSVNCMTKWLPKWLANGWMNAKGKEVVNRDLIEEAIDLEARLNRAGRVKYVWVPRAQNAEADRAANEAMDNQILRNGGR